jgi:hypothetical protein
MDSLIDMNIEEKNRIDIKRKDFLKIQFTINLTIFLIGFLFFILVIIGVPYVINKHKIFISIAAVLTVLSSCSFIIQDFEFTRIFFYVSWFFNLVLITLSIVYLVKYQDWQGYGIIDSNFLITMTYYPLIHSLLIQIAILIDKKSFVNGSGLKNLKGIKENVNKNAIIARLLSLVPFLLVYIYSGILPILSFTTRYQNEIIYGRAFAILLILQITCFSFAVTLRNRYELRRGVKETIAIIFPLLIFIAIFFYELAYNDSSWYGISRSLFELYEGLEVIPYILTNIFFALIIGFVIGFYSKRMTTYIFGSIMIFINFAFFYGFYLLRITNYPGIYSLSELVYAIFNPIMISVFIILGAVVGKLLFEDYWNSEKKIISDL